MFIEKIWYTRPPSFFSKLLLPLAGIFYILSSLRRFLYDYGFKKTYRFSVPIVVIGNITVGGTGKTPLVIWLAQFLQQQGFRPGIVSRGVGGKKHASAYWVHPHSSPSEVGDEALLFIRHAHCPVVLCVDRVQAVRALINTTQCNIVITDDGLQHYRLSRDIEIAVMDGERDVGNGYLLPAGPLRELPSRLQHVDFILRQGEKAQRGEYRMMLRGENIIAVKSPHYTFSMSAWRSKKVHAVAGIGHPARFFKMLIQHGLDIIPHEFPDHYLFKPGDFDFQDELPILMTEKDAVKCELFADTRYWYLPVIADVEPHFEQAFLTELQRKKII